MLGKVLFGKRRAENKLAWLPNILVHLLLARSKLSKVTPLFVVFGIVNMALVVPVEDALIEDVVDLLPFTLEAVDLRIPLNQIHLH